MLHNAEALPHGDTIASASTADPQPFLFCPFYTRSSQAYLARTLSYDGAEFNVERVEMSAEFVRMYDKAMAWWQELFAAIPDAQQRWQRCTGEPPNKRWANAFWGQCGRRGAAVAGFTLCL